MNPVELDRLAKYRAVCNGISFGQALVEVIELSQPRPAKDLRKDINLKTRQIKAAEFVVSHENQRLPTDWNLVYAASTFPAPKHRHSQHPCS